MVPGRDRHCVQPDVVSSAVRGLLSVLQASRLQVARLGRARSAASARRQVSICRRNRGAAWHWRQALQWRRRCDEGKSIGDAGAGRSLKSSESRMRSVPEGKQQGQRQRQTPLSGRDKRQKAGVIHLPVHIPLRPGCALTLRWKNQAAAHVPELFNDSGIRMTSSRVDAIHENDPAIFTDYRAGQNNIITCSYLQRRGERIERIEREGGVVPTVCVCV